MKNYYRKIDRTAKYIAANVPGVFDPIPSWFELLVQEGTLRYNNDGMIEVKVITGAWQLANSGEVVVLQQGGDVYLVEQEDFARLWIKV